MPVDNARYALNAANARWGSLYDALYGTDVLEDPIKSGYDQNRAEKVVSYVRNFLDEIFPLNKGSWKNINKIEVDDKILVLNIDGERNNLKNIYQNSKYKLIFSS